MRQIFVLMGTANDAEAQARAEALTSWGCSTTSQVMFSGLQGVPSRSNDRAARGPHAGRRRGSRLAKDGYHQLSGSPRGAGGRWKAKLRAHTTTYCSRDLRRRTEEVGASRNVGKGLVDGNSFDERSEIIKHIDGSIAQPLVILEMSADKDQLRSRLNCSSMAG
jgi:hypothetical protein